MKKLFNKNTIRDSKRHIKAALYAVLFAAILVSPELMAAAGTFTCAQAGASIKSFFENISGILGIVSVVIVTIAICFAGYQIAFAHKRLSDVSGVLIGALLIGAAGTLAAWLLSAGGTGNKC